MRLRLLIAICLVISAPSAARIFAQNSVQSNGNDPTLQKRGSATGSSASPALRKSPAGFSTLPPDASGEYLIDDSGSTVEITLEANRLSGYVTKMGDEQSDKNTPLTFFFDQASVSGSQLRFTTKKVHGIWYGFTGSIARGDPKTPRNENGYYRLEGQWSTYNDANGSQSSARVSLKSTPRQDGSR